MQHFFYWVLGPRRTTSVVLQEVPIISPLLGLEPSSDIPPGTMRFFFFFFLESSPMHLSAYIGRYHRLGLIMSLVKVSQLSIIGHTHYSPYLNTKVKDFQSIIGRTHYSTHYSPYISISCCLRMEYLLRVGEQGFNGHSPSFKLQFCFFFFSPHFLGFQILYLIYELKKKNLHHHLVRFLILTTQKLNLKLSEE